MAIPTRLPGFTYTGEYETQLREDWGWVIRFKTDGVLTFTDRSHKIDVFLVGGGGGGGGAFMQYCGAGGGGGGYSSTYANMEVTKGTGYAITIGAGGAGATERATGGAGTASTFQSEAYTAGGGLGGPTGGFLLEDRIPGGAGGADGGYGGALHETGGAGEDGVFEFGMTGWNRYGGGGGGGGGSYGEAVNGGAGGAGGGGMGGTGGSGNDGIPYDGSDGSPGTANTGGGGGGAGAMETSYTLKGGAGGSGIVCIRNSAGDTLPVVFNGTWLSALYLNGVEATGLMVDGVRLFIRRIAGMLRRERAMAR